MNEVLDKSMRALISAVSTAFPEAAGTLAEVPAATVTESEAGVGAAYTTVVHHSVSQTAARTVDLREISGQLELAALREQRVLSSEVSV